MLKTTLTNSKTAENQLFFTQFQSISKEIKKSLKERRQQKEVDEGLKSRSEGHLESLEAVGGGSTRIMFKKKVLELNELLNSAVHFITKYDVESCRSTINELNGDITKLFDQDSWDSTTAQQPSASNPSTTTERKKKFAFKKSASTAAASTTSAAKPTPPPTAIKKVSPQDETEQVIISNRVLWISNHADFPSAASTILDHCLVIMNVPICPNLFIHHASDCVFVFMGSVAAFGMIQYVKRSIVYLPFGIGQLRIHDCVGLALVGAVWNDPIIEDCTEVFVGECSKQNQDTLDECKPNKITNVQDFNWLSQSASPNFKARAQADVDGIDLDITGLVDLVRPDCMKEAAGGSSQVDYDRVKELMADVIGKATV